MGTTPNYSWVFPDPTDLVKDLPADFETFADAADATVKALSPGTTAGDLDYYTSGTAKARLGIGTAGQALIVNSGATAPEWAALNAYTQIATGTLSGASVALTSIPATYRHLQLIIRQFLPATDASGLRLRFNNNSSTTYATADVIEEANESFNATQINIGATNDNSVATGLHIINIYDYANAVTWKLLDSLSIVVQATTTTNYNYRSSRGFWNQTDAINELNLSPSAGNFTSGTYFLLGVK